MRDIFPELFLLLVVLTGVGSCACYQADRVDHIIVEKIQEAMEVRR